MRIVENTQMHFGEIAIAQIEIDSKSRDDIAAVLKGLQHIYTNPPLRERVFALLLEQVRPGVDLKVGRPGMDLWRIFVLAVLKQGLGCDFDRLQSLRINTRRYGRCWGRGRFQKRPDELLPVADADRQCVAFESATVVADWPGNSGKRSRGGEKKAWRAIARALDSFVVETDVHYPTDIGLLYDSMRCVIRERRGRRKNAVWAAGGSTNIWNEGYGSVSTGCATRVGGTTHAR